MFLRRFIDFSKLQISNLFNRTFEMSANKEIPESNTDSSVKSDEKDLNNNINDNKSNPKIDNQG